MTSVNKNAPVKAKKDIQINASPSQVWELLSDINNWHEWNNDIKESKLNGSLAVGSTFDWKSGGTKIHSTLHTVTPHKKLGWSGKAFGSFAIHNWTLTDVNGSTKVVVEESMEGTLMRFFRGFMQNTLEKGMDSWLIQLKKAAEKTS